MTVVFALHEAEAIGPKMLARGGGGVLGHPVEAEPGGERRCAGDEDRLDAGAVPGYYRAMALAHSKVTAQGQISVPAEVRRKLGVGPGSVLEWDEEGATVVVRRAARYSSQDLHDALFARAPRRRSLAELKDGIRRYVRRRHARR